MDPRRRLAVLETSLRTSRAALAEPSPDDIGRTALSAGLPADARWPGCARPWPTASRRRRRPATPSRPALREWYVEGDARGAGVRRDRRGGARVAAAAGGDGVPRRGRARGRACPTAGAPDRRRPATTGQPCGSTGRSPLSPGRVRPGRRPRRRRRRTRARSRPCPAPTPATTTRRSWSTASRTTSWGGTPRRSSRSWSSSSPDRARLSAGRRAVARWRPWTPSPRSPPPSTSRSGSTPPAAPSAPSSSRPSSGWPASRAS